MKQGNEDAMENVEEYYPNYVHVSGISNVSSTNVVKTEYYSIDGKKISHPTTGIVIRRQTLSDGSVTVGKVIL